jgi:hypothetical protein
MSGPTRHSCDASELHTGDHLLRLGGVGYAQLRDTQGTPVIVGEVRPPVEGTTPGEKIVEILTSAGVLYARSDAPALITRDDTVTPGTILLISRRPYLHARLSELGVPVIRRTPVASDTTAQTVTDTEWATAPLIVIDAYLAVATLQRMWSRGDLYDRDQIVMVGTDPDDARVEARSATAHARSFFLIPHDAAQTRDLFVAATDTTKAHDPYLGILTPTARH